MASNTDYPYKFSALEVGDSFTLQGKELTKIKRRVKDGVVANSIVKMEYGNVYAHVQGSLEVKLV